MTMTLRKAERKQAKLRIGLAGPSGSGKTYSALLLASAFAPWEKIAVIDSENGSGELYSHLGPYNVITLTAPFTPERYIEAIRSAEDAGMDVIIIDSASHEWEGKGGVLELNDVLAQAKFRGNTWAAWSETTPRHRKFIDAMLQSPAHVIATVRSKTDTIQTEDKKVKKVGTKEIQREGWEYELTVNFNVDRERHLATASKDRTGLFIDNDPFVITKETGIALIKWAESGKAEDPNKRQVFVLLHKLGVKPTTKEEAEAAVLELTGIELTDENLADIAKKLTERLSAPQDGPEAPETNEAPAETEAPVEAPAAKKTVSKKSTESKLDKALED